MVTSSTSVRSDIPARLSGCGRLGILIIPSRSRRRIDLTNLEVQSHFIAVDAVVPILVSVALLLLRINYI